MKPRLITFAGCLVGRVRFFSLRVLALGLLFGLLLLFHFHLFLFLVVFFGFGLRALLALVLGGLGCVAAAATLAFGLFGATHWRRQAVVILEIVKVGLGRVDELDHELFDALVAVVVLERVGDDSARQILHVLIRLNAALFARRKVAMLEYFGPARPAKYEQVLFHFVAFVARVHARVGVVRGVVAGAAVPVGVVVVAVSIRIEVGILVASLGALALNRSNGLGLIGSIRLKINGDEL